MESEKAAVARRNEDGILPVTATGRSCPVCDHQVARVLHSQRLILSDDHGGSTDQRVVLCERCRAAFADTATTQTQYDELYARRSRYAAGPAAHSRSSDRDIGRFRGVAGEVASILPSRDAKILDVGCANGQMLRALAELGYRNLFGVDPSAACVAEASAIPGVTAAGGSLSKLPADGRRYDLVILSHVLEHVRDAKPALQAVKTLLEQRAMLYVEVPDASRYADFAWSPFQDFNSEHINHFSAVSIDNLLHQCALRSVRAGAKEILSAPGMPYPAIYTFAVRDEATSCEPVLDETIEGRLRAYVRRSRGLMVDIDRRLSAYVRGAPGVIVWGTGELTAKLLANTVLGDATVLTFVDSNPINQGRFLRGVRIAAPVDLRSGPELIVVASILHHEEIVRTVRSLGLRNPIVGLAADAVPAESD